MFIFWGTLNKMYSISNTLNRPEKICICIRKKHSQCILGRTRVPHDDLHQPHGSLVQRVEEVQQDAAPGAHLADDQAEHGAEHDEAQHVHPLRVRARDLVLLGDVLPGGTQDIHSCLFG